MSSEARSAADRQIALGNEYEDGGAFEAALSCYLDAIKTAPDYPRAQLNLASALEHVAAVALAAKNARIAWALLAHERSYQHDYVATRKGRVIAVG